MARYLVTLSLGPVQSLIEAARRTRDLWCGSWLLAESAKAAARVLHQQQPGCLIFPCPVDPESELAPQERPGDKEANIANILRAEVDLPDEAAVRALLAEAKQAAARRLTALSDKARAQLGSIPIHESLWQAQKVDILESFSAWVELGAGGYPVASARLGGALAARKATRDFVPAARSAHAEPAFGVPKSSLDGARESVLNLPRKDRERGAHKNTIRRLGLGAGEELDVLAVAKRLAGEVEQFTAYSRIAADSWADKLADSALDPINKAYEPLVGLELATRVSGNDGCYRRLPFDAQLVFGFRLDSVLADADDEERVRLLALRSALKGLDEPVPYAVILKADGDRMGELLGKAQCADDSRAISKALHGFSCSVRRLVREHRGHAIYAGGDDVLALLPLDSAVHCAAALAQHFRESMAGIAKTLGVEAAPTLSVGLGIGHIVEPLGRLRARADKAERFAKGDGTDSPRNALAIVLGIRSGAETSWRSQWDGGGDPLQSKGLQALQVFIEAYRANECPSRLGYELREIAQRLGWAKDSASELPGIHAAELGRTLQRARQRGGEASLSTEFCQSVTERAGVVGLEKLADELIVTRWLSARTRTDLGVLA
jgi:CRISPR-associated protein Cmr2